MRPTTDSRSCRSQTRWTGVCPDGAQVRRRTGWSMKPLSSKKTTGLPRRRAPFLSAANPVSANAPWRHRPPRVLAARASGRSSPGREASSQRDRGDTPHGTSWRLPRRLADTSRGRSSIRPFAARPRESRSVAASASRRDEACGRDVVWRTTPLGLLSPQPDATVSPNPLKHQRSLRPRRHRCIPATIALPAVDELAARLRFLSVSCTTIRMSTYIGSLALQGSITIREDPGRYPPWGTGAPPKEVVPKRPRCATDVAILAADLSASERTVADIDSTVCSTRATRCSRSSSLPVARCSSVRSDDDRVVLSELLEKQLSLEPLYARAGQHLEHVQEKAVV